MKIKKVTRLIITGKDKGKQGKVIAAYRADGILMKDVNRVKNRTEGRPHRQRFAGRRHRDRRPSPFGDVAARRGEGRRQGRHARGSRWTTRATRSRRCQRTVRT